ncbi:hypothetical protein MNV_210010 [Candidatus Methanoperedens nitroreducens]|uniref:Uncharacterized protein n=1 Tax=Candidatus Methanoperedens nitratireducens TaxID=1392998 RepID=A0A284VNW4_9EURY|nr:hypothetical protein MNV_210010 [Candidatus Methanoperedens nitroreducens]
MMQISTSLPVFPLAREPKKKNTVDKVEVLQYFDNFFYTSFDFYTFGLHFVFALFCFHIAVISEAIIIISLQLL